MAVQAAGEALRAIPGEAPFELWWIDAQMPPSAEALGQLSAAERERAARFHFARDRDRYLAAHAGLRALIERRFAIPPARQRFAFGAQGKPRLADAPGCRFNMSYAEGVALVGLSARDEIGVDVEARRPIPDMEDLADLHFTPAERRHLAALPSAAARLTGFFAAWSRKEACLKALGTGLSLTPSALDTGVDFERRRVRAPDAVLETAAFVPAPGYVAAWARIVG